MELGQLADFLADIVHGAGDVGSVIALEGAVGRQRLVELSEAR